MRTRRSSIGCNRSALAVSALLWLSAGCTDDFSRFQFGQNKPARPRDAGPQNVSDAAKNDAGAEALQNMLLAGEPTEGPQLDAGPPAQGGRGGADADGDPDQ